MSEYEDENEPPPYVLTEKDLPQLVTAIHAAGFRIMTDIETGEITLEPLKSEQSA